jgi:hypothetical protein
MYFSCGCGLTSAVHASTILGLAVELNLEPSGIGDRPCEGNDHFVVAGIDPDVIPVGSDNNRRFDQCPLPVRVNREDLDRPVEVGCKDGHPIPVKVREVGLRGNHLVSAADDTVQEVAREVRHGVDPIDLASPANVLDADACVGRCDIRICRIERIDEPRRTVDEDPLRVGERIHVNPEGFEVRIPRRPTVAVLQAQIVGINTGRNGRTRERDFRQAGAWGKCYHDLITGLQELAAEVTVGDELAPSVVPLQVQAEVPRLPYGVPREAGEATFGNRDLGSIQVFSRVHGHFGDFSAAECEVRGNPLVRSVDCGLLEVRAAVVIIRGADEKRACGEFSVDNLDWRCGDTSPTRMREAGGKEDRDGDDDVFHMDLFFCLAVVGSVTGQ